MTRSLRLAQKIYANGSKLTASDLLSKEDYERERANLLRLATQHRRQRRLRLNPSLSLVFETRFTAWLQIQVVDVLVLVKAAIRCASPRVEREAHDWIDVGRGGDWQRSSSPIRASARVRQAK